MTLFIILCVSDQKKLFLATLVVREYFTFKCKSNV